MFLIIRQATIKYRARIVNSRAGRSAIENPGLRVGGSRKARIYPLGEITRREGGVGVI